MPKTPAHALLWSAENHIYLLHTSAHPPQPIIPGNEDVWRAWLTTHSSFSFQGQHGRLNVLKEFRPRGTGYWYAYHTHSGQTKKRYLGGSETVTLVRLEEVAQDLQEGKQEPLSQPSHAAAVPVSLHTTPVGKETPSSIVLPGSEINDPSTMMVMIRLSPPRLPATLVVRERLLAALDTALSHPLTLLSASAGWGKTTLLSAWAQRRPQSVAWLSLEALDNDPTRFWVEVVTALRQHWPEMGERALALLQGPESLFLSLTTLLNELANRSAETSPILLILDDYHVIDEPTIHTSLTFWLEHLPSHVHLLLASRVDPDLPLSRFRARGHLGEIRDTDLRFTQAETDRFLTQSMGLALSESEVALLEDRTEGWIASLHLAALMLQKQTDLSASVHRFSGNQRSVLDYLREEVFTSLSAELQMFLLQTSWMNPLSASLCDAITGREDSHRLLEQVERANLFLQPLDESRQWYRYHALWSQAMQHEARLRLGAVTLRSLSSKASRWYEQQQLLPEAIEATLTCEEFSRAVILIERYTAPKGFAKEYHLIRSWLRRMPEEVLQAQPELCFLYAVTLMSTTERRSPETWTRCEQLIQWAVQGFEATEQREKLGLALQLHADLTYYQEDLGRMFALLHQSRPLMTEHSLLYPDYLVFSGVEGLLAGEVNMAWQGLLKGYRRLISLGDRFSAAFATALVLGEVCLEKGELHRASHYYDQALVHVDENEEISHQQLLLETGEKEPFFVSWGYHCLAQLAYERNALADAQRYQSHVLALREKQEEGVHVLASGALIQARLLHVSGEAAQAQALLSKWEMHTHFPWSVRAIRTCRARLQLASGELSAVEQWAQEKQHTDLSQIPEQEKLPFLWQQEEALLLVRLHIAQKRGEIVLQELAPWKEQALAQGRMRSVLEIQILEALAHAACQEQSLAKSALLQAVKLAHAENFQRLFLDEGPAMEVLLKTLLPELREASLSLFVRTLLYAFAGEPETRSAEKAALPRGGSLPLEPLGEQEQRVLRLLVAGRSNPEIANALVISLNTVKTHVQSLYRKLDVHNRVEASEVARRLSLL